MRAAAFAAVLLLAAAGPAAAQSLRIWSGGCEHRFTVEIAQTPKVQERGLMYRKELMPDKGMLFIWPDSALRSMWMKNTFIPLDMLFITGSGRIAYIAPMREPHSTRITRSGEPVSAVLELAGGTAAQLLMRVGDRVYHPALRDAKPFSPKPPCAPKQRQKRQVKAIQPNR